MFNLLLVLCVTFGFAAVMIYFIASHDQKLQRRINEKSPADGSTKLTDREFFKLCLDFCENFKLEVVDIAQAEVGQVMIRAKSDNPIISVEYLVAGFLLAENQELDLAQISSISDQIISERLSKAIVVTTGKIPEGARTLPELAPMEFVDGKKLKELSAGFFAR